MCGKLTRRHEGQSLFHKTCCADSGCQVLLVCCQANKGSANVIFNSCLLQIEWSS